MERKFIKAVVGAAVLTISVGAQAAWAERSYDAGRMRFMQTDPLSYQDGVNLYAYVGQNPVTWVDPAGNRRFPGCLGSAMGKIIGIFQSAFADFLSGAIVGILTGTSPLEWGIWRVQTYGNYCGAGWGCWDHNGLGEGWSGGPPGAPGRCLFKQPKDELDVCCQHHDACMAGAPDNQRGPYPVYYNPYDGTWSPLEYDPFGSPEGEHCNGLFCQCMAGLDLEPGSRAYVMRQRMRLTFGCVPVSP